FTLLCLSTLVVLSYLFTGPTPAEIFPLSLHDALPISALMFASISSGALISILLFYLSPLPIMVAAFGWGPLAAAIGGVGAASVRSEEHTSELQLRENLVCRLLLEKKKTISRSLY